MTQALIDRNGLISEIKFIWIQWKHRYPAELRYEKREIDCESI
jgi:hypothetical protein